MRRLNSENTTSDKRVHTASGHREHTLAKIFRDVVRYLRASADILGVVLAAL